jgi:hypothetical protein
VQVLDHQHQRLPLGDPVEQGCDELEQVTPAGLADGVRWRWSQLGQEPREVLLTPVENLRAVGVHQPAQRGRERREGQALLAELQALAGEYTGALRGGHPAELLDQAGLADARLAADQHGRRLGVAGALQGVAQHGEVGLPADQELTAGLRRHAVEHVTPRARRACPEKHGHDDTEARPCGGRRVGQCHRERRCRPAATSWAR